MFREINFYVVTAESRCCVSRSVH